MRGGSGQTHIIIRNPKTAISTTDIKQTATGITVAQEFSLDLTIIDKDGNALSGASVKIEDHDGNIVSCEEKTYSDDSMTTSETDFTVGDGSTIGDSGVIKCNQEYMNVTGRSTNVLTVTRGYYTGYPALVHANRDDLKVYKVNSALQTDVNGQIETQYLTTWFLEGLSETVYPDDGEFTYTITISKTGYQTLVLENITIDSPIDWHLKLQPIGHPPAPWEHNV